MKGLRVNIYIKLNQLVNNFLNVSMSTSSIFYILRLFHWGIVLGKNEYW